MPTTVFHATSRAPIAGATAPPFYGLDATPGAEDGLNTGQAEVTTADEPESPRRIISVTPDPAPDGKTPSGKTPLGKAAKLVSPAVAAWAEAAIAGQQDAVLLVHGYANTWEDSILRAAQFRDFYAQAEGGTARPFAVLAFGWPSDGLVMPPNTHYPADRKDAAAAGPAMATLLAEVARVAPAIRGRGLKLHLIAHSMGNWALRHGLAAHGPPRGAAPLFDEALLTAADEDTDALADPAKLAALPALASRITVNVYDMDVILFIARHMTGELRLGQHWPPPLPAGRDDAALRVSPSVIELTDPNLTGHQYYRNNLAIRRDVIAVLEGRAQHSIRGRVVDLVGEGMFVLFGATSGDPPMV